MADLNTALAVAAEAHAGQFDRAGKPYVLHPLRLMWEMETETEMIVALLHDVVEDNEAWTLERLTAVGFSQEVVTAVDALSRRSDESYETFIERIRPNPLAVRVKLADLRDNMNPLRLEKLTERDLERLVKYHQAWQVLNGR